MRRFLTPFLCTTFAVFPSSAVHASAQAVAQEPSPSLPASPSEPSDRDEIVRAQVEALMKLRDVPMSERRITPTVHSSNTTPSLDVLEQPKSSVMAGGSGVAPYAIVDNFQQPSTNLNLTPYRPMAATADNFHLYAVNVHGSTVRHWDFTPGVGTNQTWRVPFGPVSIALWDNHDDGRARLLVVSRGTHALTILDRLTGAPIDMIDLPFEPADILIDRINDLAYISCSGERVVIEVNLMTLATQRFPIPALQPTWLSWDAHGRVLVAPLISGNNSITLAFNPLLESTVLDLNNPAFMTTGLPDEDLFAIDPTAGTVTAVSRSAGTILFAHELNPVTGNHWQLGIESINKDPLLQTEPALNGRFALNRLTLTTLPAPGSPIVSTHTQIELDDSNPATPAIDYLPTQTIGLPTGLTFATSGFGVICGPSTDNVMVLAPGGSGFTEGQLIFEFDVPAGSIPRSVLLDPATQTIALVYCWGTNQVLAYGLAPFNPTPLVFDLGFDPSPPAVRAGRQVFYDASLSSNNHLTCGTCHIDGTSDQLAWNLSDKPRDTKGPLHTQTLMGIDRLAPFHWRGERPVLPDFTGAFTGLLGSSTPPTTQQFSDFQAFVFSLRNPANIGADEERQLNDALATPLPNGLTGSAVNGQNTFINTPYDAGGALTCTSCHFLPTASNNDLIPEVAKLIPGLTHMETTAFNELEDKDMPIVNVVSNVTVPPIVIAKPLTGFGLLHDGTINSRFDFANAFGGLTLQERADVAEYMFQFDSGLAKAAHRGTLVDRAHPANAARLANYLIPQANLGNCSIAIYGVYPIAGVSTPLQWAYRPATADFLPDNSSVAPVAAATFVATLTTVGARNLVIGLPPGNAIKAAVDYDTDELVNQDETALGTNPFVADTDGDGEFDGIEVQNGTNPTNPASVVVDTLFPAIVNPLVEWVTAKNARITFTTSEPCSVQLTYVTAAGPSKVVSVPDFEKVHNLLATELLPSTNLGAFTLFHNYTGTLQVTDSSGNQTITMVNFTSGDFLPVVLPAMISVVSNLSFPTVTRVGGTITVSGTAQVDLKLGGPPAFAAPNYVVVGNVLVDGVISAFTQTPSDPQSFTISGTPHTALPGPFLITPMTNGSGSVNFNFSVSGLTAGQEVTFNVIGVFSTIHATTPYNPAAPNFGDANVVPPTVPLNALPELNWSLGDTPVIHRSESVIF